MPGPEEAASWLGIREATWRRSTRCRVLGEGHHVSRERSAAGDLDLRPAYRGRRKLLLWSALGFMSLAAPLVVLTSMYRGHFTFGDSSRLNYAYFVNRVPYFLLEVMKTAGAQLAVSNEVPPTSQAVGWTHIPESPYYYIDLRSWN